MKSYDNPYIGCTYRNTASTKGRTTGGTSQLVTNYRERVTADSIYQPFRPTAKDGVRART